MAMYRTIGIFFFAVLTVVAAQRRFIPTQTRVTDAPVCRGEFDCKDPFECVNRRCVELPKSCRYPGKPNFGLIHPDTSRYDVGAEIRYTCLQGYRLVGQSTAVCQDNRTWSRARPRCVVTKCSHPGTPYRGLVTPEKDFYQLGETVQIACKSFYQLVGPNNSQCREDGTWSRELPRCERPEGV